jgi:hypothetical protein
MAQDSLPRACIGGYPLPRRRSGVRSGPSHFILGNRMFRIALVVWFALCSTPVFAGDLAPLSIGGKEIQVDVPAGYVRASEKAPSLFATSAAALPPTLRLVETLVAESDIKRMLAGESLAQAYVQVQVMRDAEGVDFSDQEWRALQPTMAKGLGATDLDATTKALQSGMGDRMSKAAGGAIEIKYGAVGKPRVYSQAGDVIRFVLRLPISGNVNGKDVHFLLECAGAVLVLNGKLLMINAYQPVDAPDDNFTKVRAFLDPIVERAQALNASSAPGAPTKAD